jgi:hypothetical protein
MPGLKLIMTSVEDASSMPAAEDAVERIAVMQEQETGSYRHHDYIASVRKSGGKARVDRRCRVKMVEWCYQITDYCKFRRETVAICFSYLDRFLASPSPRATEAIQSRKVYQLAAMTTLYIATKLFEPMAMDTVLLSTLSQGVYSEREITDMEREILQALGWKMNGPTARDFISHMLALLPKSAYYYDESILITLLDFSKFQADLAVSDYELSLETTFTVAIASLLNSMEGIGEKLLPAQERFHFLGVLAQETAVDPFSVEVNVVRDRLLELFAENTGYHLPQIANLTPIEIGDEKENKYGLTWASSPKGAEDHSCVSFNTTSCAFDSAHIM